MDPYFSASPSALAAGAYRLALVLGGSLGLVELGLILGLRLLQPRRPRPSAPSRASRLPRPSSARPRRPASRDLRVSDALSRFSSFVATARAASSFRWPASASIFACSTLRFSSAFASTARCSASRFSWIRLSRSGCGLALFFARLLERLQLLFGQRRSGTGAAAAAPRRLNRPARHGASCCAGGGTSGSPPAGCRLARRGCGAGVLAASVAARGAGWFAGIARRAHVGVGLRERLRRRADDTARRATAALPRRPSVRA